MTHHTDFCILGAGLAGCSLADALQKHDLSTVIIDKDTIAAGSSGTPGGLVNPATGRRGTKSWKAEECYRAIAQNLRTIQSNTEKTFFLNNGLLRPALFKKMARKMKEQYKSTCWPEGWCHWKNEDEIKKMHPGITCVDGGVWLPIGLSVNIGAYLKNYADYLKKNGTIFFLNQKPNIINEDKVWKVVLDDENISAKNLVFATGHYTKKSYWWDWLPLRLIKGQIAKFKSLNGSLSFSHSISSLGYMARTGDADSFIQGSTYEHDFEHLNPDAEGEAYLTKRMLRTLPHLEKKVVPVDQWAGVRTSTPNRKPILGRHPIHQNLHVFTGLGSKGLLYCAFLANHYAKNITGQTSLFPEVDINRFTKK